MIETYIIAGIIGVGFSLMTQIMWDWLKNRGNKNGIDYYVRKDLCELKHAEMNKLLETKFDIIIERLEKIENGNKHR